MLQRTKSLWTAQLFLGDRIQTHFRLLQIPNCLESGLEAQVLSILSQTLISVCHWCHQSQTLGRKSLAFQMLLQLASPASIELHCMFIWESDGIILAIAMGRDYALHANLQVRPGDLPLLQLIFSLQRSFPLDTIAVVM